MLLSNATLLLSHCDTETAPHRLVKEVGFTQDNGRCSGDFPTFSQALPSLEQTPESVNIWSRQGQSKKEGCLGSRQAENLHSVKLN